MNRKLKVFAKLLVYYSPGFIQRPLQKRVREMELERNKEIARRTRLTREQVTDVLGRFHFDSDVMLHCSMVNLGRIQGGAKFFANALLDAVDTTHHTLIVSALPYRGRFASWLSEDRVFDVRTAPVAMGAVNELLASMPCALRSVHPTHSVVAIGPDAAAYTSTHHLGETPFGSQSPYYQLIARRAKILLAGATYNNVTFVHAIEDMLGDVYPVNPYAKKRYHVPCIDAEGRKVTVVTPVHAPYAGITRDSSVIGRMLAERGLVQTEPLGEGSVTMFDCRDYTLAYLDYLAEGRSIYGRHRVTPQLRQRIDEIKATLLSSD